MNEKPFAEYKNVDIKIKSPVIISASRSTDIPAFYAQQRIETFIRLSKKIGKNKVIWRFDPLILTDEINVEDLLGKIENTGDQLKNYTEKLVFSFADIEIYRKVEQNLRRNSIRYKEFDEDSMLDFARGLEQLNRKWNLEIGVPKEFHWKGLE